MLVKNNHALMFEWSVSLASAYNAKRVAFDATLSSSTNG
ncbi:hypothetical protein A6A12_1350 [Vibrio anguillarum]|nr:hypothetical protein A6A12_1350 [Vibrio anguillarum]